MSDNQRCEPPAVVSQEDIALVEKVSIAGRYFVFAAIPSDGTDCTVETLAKNAAKRIADLQAKLVDAEHFATERNLASQRAYELVGKLVEMLKESPYSSSWDAMRLVVEEMRRRGYWCRLDTPIAPDSKDEDLICHENEAGFFKHGYPPTQSKMSYADTLPEAVALAALKALKGYDD